MPRYYGQPALARPMPMARPGRTDNRALLSLLAGIFGLVLSFLGLPGLVLGPIAYFLGRSSVNRIQESKGQLGGHSTAVAGWAIGVVAMVFGAIVTLTVLILFLLSQFGPPPI